MSVLGNCFTCLDTMSESYGRYLPTSRDTTLSDDSDWDETTAFAHDGDIGVVAKIDAIQSS